MIDTARIKQDTNLLALIGTDTTLRRVASTQRGEYAGPCPFCRAGEDRFRVQPSVVCGGAASAHPPSTGRTPSTT
jgi:hypothetical protein